MIRYALCCDEGHRFDSWFPDSVAFDTQAARGLVTCPNCASGHVVKAIMAPAVVARGSQGLVRAEAASVEPANKSEPIEVALVGDEKRQMVRAFRAKVLAETRDVGRGFAAEARRIHDDDASDERIRGQATIAEARDLLEDGILILPLPALPEDLN